MLAPDYATPVRPARLDPVTGAHHKLVLALTQHRPRPLDVVPSPAALERRAADVDALMLEFRDYIAAVLDDCGQNMSLPADVTAIWRAQMDDAMGDVRGALTVAVDEAREDARAVRRIG